MNQGEVFISVDLDGSKAESSAVDTMKNISKESDSVLKFFRYSKQGMTGLVKGFSDVAKRFSQMQAQSSSLRRQFAEKRHEAERLRAELDKIRQQEIVPKSIQRMEKEMISLTNTIARTQTKLQTTKQEIGRLMEQASLRGGEDRLSDGERNRLADLREQARLFEERLRFARTEAQRLRGTLETVRFDPTQTVEAQKMAQDLAKVTDELGQLEQQAGGAEGSVGGLTGAMSALGVKGVVVGAVIGTTIMAVGKLTSAIKQAFARLKAKLSEIATELNIINKLMEKMRFTANRLWRYFSQLLLRLVFMGALRAIQEALKNIFSFDPQIMHYFGQIKANLYIAFAPLYHYVLPAFYQLLEVIARVTASLATFSAKLFGMSLDEAKARAKALYEQAKGYDAIGASAKKAGKQLAPFDDLNILGAKQTGGGGMPAIEFAPPVWDMEETGSWFEKIKEFFSKFNFEPLMDSWDRFKIAFEPVADFFEKAFAGIWEHFLEPNMEWIIEEGLPRFLDILSDIADNIDWDNLLEHLNDFWKALQPFAERIGEGLLDFLEDVIAPLAKKLINEGLPSALESMTDGLTNLMNAIDDPDSTLNWFIKDVLTPLWDMSKEIGTEIWDRLGQSISLFKDRFSELSSNANFQRSISLITEAGTAIGEFLGKLLVNLSFDQIDRTIENIFDMIESSLLMFDDMVDMFSKLKEGDFWGALESLESAFSHIFDGVMSQLDTLTLGFTSWAGEFVSSWFNDIKDAINNFSFKDLGGSVLDLILAGAGVKGTEWEEYWTGLWETVKRIFSMGVLLGKNMILNIISGVKEKFTYFRTNIEDFWQTVRTLFSPTRALGIGMSVINNIINGINDRFAGFRARINELWTVFPDLFTVARAQSIGNRVINNIASALGNTGLIKTRAEQAWKTIQDVFAVVPQWIQNKFTEAWNGITRLFTGSNSLTISLTQSVSTAFFNIVNRLRNALNSVFKTVFGQINDILDKIRDFSVMGAKPFSSLGSITIPQIPMLAQGAVLPPNKPFMAMVGDQKHGTNIEAPLETIKQALAEVMNGSQQGLGNITIPVYVGGRKVDEFVIQSNQIENYRRGGI